MTREKKLSSSSMLIELASRLVYSLLRAAVRVAARFRMPMDRFVQLSQVAYFEEHRHRAPKDLARVAQALDLSLRTAGTLNRRGKKDEFFRPEREIEPLRRVAAALKRGPKTQRALEQSLTDIEPPQLQRALEVLLENEWVEQQGQRYALRSGIRSYVHDDMGRRIDGLNRQMDVLASSVWARFVTQDERPGLGRTWVFSAREEDLAPMFEKTVHNLRHQAIDLEEKALKEGGGQQYGITIALAPMKEEE